jgi:hypothetical protein
VKQIKQFRTTGRQYAANRMISMRGQMAGDVALPLLETCTGDRGAETRGHLYPGEIENPT